MEVIEENNVEVFGKFRNEISKSLSTLLDGVKIDSAAQYFGVWIATRTIMAEELQRLVNDEICAEVVKMQEDE